MAKAPGVNVVVRGDDWVVRRDNADRASRVFDRKVDAVEFARGVAMREETELRIQNKEGKWNDMRSYGPDPFPPEG